MSAVQTFGKKKVSPNIFFPSPCSLSLSSPSYAHLPVFCAPSLLDRHRCCPRHPRPRSHPTQRAAHLARRARPPPIQVLRARPRRRSRQVLQHGHQDQGQGWRTGLPGLRRQAGHRQGHRCRKSFPFFSLPSCPSLLNNSVAHVIFPACTATSSTPRTSTPPLPSTSRRPLSPTTEPSSSPTPDEWSPRSSVDTEPELDDRSLTFVPLSLLFFNTHVNHLFHALRVGRSAFQARTVPLTLTFSLTRRRVVPSILISCPSFFTLCTTMCQIAINASRLFIGRLYACLALLKKTASFS
jgi:hypothetical protein